MRLSAFVAFACTIFVSSAAFAADIPGYVVAAVMDRARPAADVAHDSERMPAETVAFAGVKPGDRVLELVPGGGYYTRILSKIVGPTGNVYAYTPDEILKVFPRYADASRAIAADPQYSNVSVLVGPSSAMNLPRTIDVIWTTQNYHDLHLEKFFPGLDLLAYNHALLASMRRGGIYLVVDHEAAPGSGLASVNLHRIDAEIVKSEVVAAGFQFDGESTILRNASDPHTMTVFDPAIRGKTDQFIFRFRRPLQ